MKKQEIIAKIAETDGLIAELVELRSALKALLLVTKAKGEQVK